MPKTTARDARAASRSFPWHQYRRGRGPLLCGLLAQVYGWHAGFGLAGVLMLIGLATYMAGYRHLRETTRAERETRSCCAAMPMDAAQWRILPFSLVVIALTGFPIHLLLPEFEHGTDLDRSQRRSRPVRLRRFRSRGSARWIPFVSIVSVPVLIALWQRQAAHGGEPGEIAKIATGAFLACGRKHGAGDCEPVQPSCLGALSVAYAIFLGVGFLYYWPTLLALVSRAAPHRLKATMMGCVFLSLFVSNNIIGWIGGFYEHMSPARFWGMHAAIAATGGAIALLLKRWLDRELIYVPQKGVMHDLVGPRRIGVVREFRLVVVRTRKDGEQSLERSKFVALDRGH
jgi:POT family proton-dependent oligopeptide transporter